MEILCDLKLGVTMISRDSPLRSCRGQFSSANIIRRLLILSLLTHRSSDPIGPAPVLLVWIVRLRNNDDNSKSKTTPVNEVGSSSHCEVEG